MDEWTQNVPLLPSRRPIFSENEIEVLLSAQVNIYERYFFSLFYEAFFLKFFSFSREKKTKYERGTCTLTSHRLIWIDYDGKLGALALNLSSIAQIEEEVKKNKREK